MPELSVDPGNPGDEAVGFDRAENGARLGIDLVDFAGPVMPNPERSFGPGETRVTAGSRRWDRGEHLACLWIDLVNATLNDLKEVLAVEGRSCVRSHIDHPHHFPARRIEGIQLVARCKPHVLTVIANSMHAFGAGER